MSETTTTKKSVSIGPRFFANERQMYQNWRVAILREMLQNAVDAPSSKEIVFSDNGQGVISILDDGRGMSKQVLEDVFFVLGESTKTGEGSDSFAGGMGAARNLICYSSNSYSIASHDYFVKGCGASYEIFPQQNHFKGCEFVIDTGETTFDFAYRFEKLTEKCTVNKLITCNGKNVDCSLRRGKHIRDFTFGEVYVNKSCGEKHKGKIYVRSNGIWMFTQETTLNDCLIIIEIYPNMAKTVLTSNRDGLKWEYERELNAFTNELATEKISALQAKSKKFQKVLSKGKGFAPKKKVVKAKPVKYKWIEPDEATGELVMKNKTYTPAQPSQEPQWEGWEKEIASVLSQDSIRGETTHTDSQETALSWKDCSMLLNEIDCPKTSRIAAKFDPQILEENETRYKLLHTWYIFCEEVASEYRDYSGNDFLFGVGYVFSERAAAICSELEGVNYYLLNPIDASGKIKYSINKKADLVAMLTLAIHEISHTHCKYHDESFANIFTQLCIRIFARMNEIFARLK